MGTAVKHARLSFVIFDIRALWCSGLNVRVPRCQKLQKTVWHALQLYSYGNSGRQRVSVGEQTDVKLRWRSARWERL